LSNPEKPQPGETSSRISVRASVSSVCHAQLLSGFRAYRVELSPRDRSEFTPEINSLTPRLNLRRNVGLHLKPNIFSHLYFSPAASVAVLFEGKSGCGQLFDYPNERSID
jgi:hypothetical protein